MLSSLASTIPAGELYLL